MTLRIRFLWESPELVTKNKHTHTKKKESFDSYRNDL